MENKEDIQADNEQSNHSTRHSELVQIGKFDPEKARFPLCIVWTPLPLISWILPCIGHTGICDSRGVIYDFAGPYTISTDDFSFGKTRKYVKLDIEESRMDEWNKAVDKANDEYRKRTHDICCDNCHSHVGAALREFEYGGSKTHNMVTVWWMTVVHSRYVSCGTVVYTYACCLVIAVVVGLCAVYNSGSTSK